MKGFAKKDSYGSDYQQVVDAFVNLTAHLPIPEHFGAGVSKRMGHEFDVMEYFTILTHLSMQEGYVLDYVYWSCAAKGEPVLYARKMTEKRYETFHEYELARGKFIGSREAYRAFESLHIDETELDFVKEFTAYSNTFLEKVHIDETEQGYFEFVVLKLLGSQFYLWWHANYYDDVIICTKSALNQVFAKNFPENVKKAAREIDVRPRIHMTQREVTVEVVVFTKWGGFYRESFLITREFPHQIHMREPENLVSFWSGVVF